MFICAKIVCGSQFVFNFEIIFSLPKTCIFATKNKKPPQILSPRDNLLFYHDPEEKQHKENIYYKSPQFPSPTSLL